METMKTTGTNNETTVSLSPVVKSGRIFNRCVHTLEDYFLSAGVVMISVLILSEAILRYLTSSMPMGIEELALLIAAWVYLIGIAMGTREDRQITVDIINMLPIPRKIDRIMNLGGDVVMILVAGIFFSYSIFYCIDVHNAGITIPAFYISLLVRELALPVGLFLLTVYAISRFVRDLHQHKQSSSLSAEKELP